MSDRVPNNARIGRLLYKALTDAAGYPNGMPVWAELNPTEKYWHAATAAKFVESLVQEGFVTLSRDIGLEGAYGEKDCAALMQHLTDRAPSERDEFESLLGELRHAFEVEQADGTQESKAST